MTGGSPVNDAAVAVYLIAASVAWLLLTLGLQRIANQEGFEQTLRSRIWLVVLALAWPGTAICAAYLMHETDQGEMAKRLRDLAE
jgi:hypothetical protein